MWDQFSSTAERNIALVANMVETWIADYNMPCDRSNFWTAWSVQEFMHLQKLDANIDPIDPLDQMPIVGNHSYLLQSSSFSMKSSFMM